MGLRPLHTGMTAQREMQATTPPAAGTTSASGEGPTVPAPWASGVDLPVTVRSLTPSANAAPEADAVPLQRLADMPASPAAPGTAIPAPAVPREIVFPARDASMGVPQWAAASPDAMPGIEGAQRPAEPGAPTAYSSHVPAPSSPTRRGAHHDGAASRGPLALARQQAPVAPVVSRTVSDTASAAARPSVQASSAPSGGSPLGGITATPIVQRVDGTAPAAPSAEGHTDAELDELARALFGRIRTHLRSEVIHEREAKGLTFDAF
jgi:hypothetical protein